MTMMPLINTISLTGVLSLLLSFKVRYCNRGFCYTKIGDDNDRRRGGVNNSGGLDYCTNGEGHVMDCELLEILGGDDDGEGVEMTGSSQSEESLGRQRKRLVWRDDDGLNSSSMTSLSDRREFEGDNHDDEIVGHVPWKDKPKKGHCIDHDLGYTFECNLIEILDEGLILIEDLRSGGVFVAHKSSFTTRRPTRRRSVKTPDVMQGSTINPLTDFRTNVALNLEGF